MIDFAEIQAELARREIARRRLLDFTRYTFPGYDTHWHHETIGRYLDQVARGEIKRLMLFAPPGHGKSELVSRRFPAFLLGRDPRLRIMATTYGSTLAEDMGRDVQRIMSEPEYAQLFGEKLSGKRTSLHFETQQVDGFYRPGYYLGVGARGSLTGRRFDLAIIDDPVKGREEAESPTIRDKLWRWYNDDFLTRASGPEAGIVLITTRWHEDDLAGRILRDASEGGEPWKVVRLPALRDDENPYPVPVEPVDTTRHELEPLWEKVAPIKTLEDLQRKPRTWTSLYQQRPSPAEGGMFRREWIRYHHREPNSYRFGSWRIRLESMIRFGVCDPAISTKASADFTVIQSWGWVPSAGALLLLDQIRAHLSGPELLDSMRQAVEKWNLSTLWVEAVSFQTLAIDQARRAGLPVRELKADKDKTTRAWPATSLFEASKIFLPSGAPYLADLEHELLTFPNGANDDQVDALAYAVRVASGLIKMGPPPPDQSESPSAFNPRTLTDPENPLGGLAPREDGEGTLPDSFLSRWTR